MENLPLPPDFSDFIKILNRLKVRYMVVGGWAVGLHGWPRLTKDIDFWVAVDAENEKLLKQALTEFRAPLPFAEDFFDNSEKNVHYMGRSPTRIEILSSVDGVDFDECFIDSVVMNIGGLGVRVIGLDALKENKRASGRLRDLADLEDLERLDC